MATNYLSLNVPPKEEKKKTVFTHYLDSDFEWEEGYPVLTRQPKDYKNVLCLGKYTTEGTYIFKCWDDDDAESYTLYRGTLGDEEYKSL